MAGLSTAVSAYTTIRTRRSAAASCPPNESGRNSSRRISARPSTTRPTRRPRLPTSEPKARAIAGAVAISDAIASYRNGTSAPTSGQPSQIGAEITEHISAISAALHSPATVNRIHRRATGTESLNAHA